MNRLFERVLQARGIDKDFLEPKYENLTPPENLPDMSKAIQRLRQAKISKEKVLVYGDYDVDGVTATTIIYDTLKLMGIADIETMLPDRFLDGYGMSRRLVKNAIEKNINLVITVDCGSNNAEIIDELSEQGIDTIVTDHHEFSGDIPERAVAVVNPKRPDFRVRNVDSGLSKLAGAGVAFNLALALANAKELPEGQEKWLLDLAMIGTICDSMELLEDNRIICHYGMIVLRKTRRPGLLELMKAAGARKIDTDTIGFQIGPRLNAAGRMETAELALRLLMTNSKIEAVKLANELNRLNLERRKQQQEAVSEVEKKGLEDLPVIVVKGNWGEGVVGIIAGRLTEKYKRPSFVLTEVDGKLKGSGRSFGDFNLALALSECQNLLIAGGGHAAACGLKLKSENYEAFKQSINDYYNSLELKNQERFLDAKEDIDTDECGELNLELASLLTKLEPFGEGNPAPVFLLKDMLVLNSDRIGSESQHLRMLIRGKDGKTLKCVAFNAPKEWLDLHSNARINVWISLMENEWNGTRSVEGRVIKLTYV